MALATLSIDLEAKLAKLEEGFTRAQQISARSAADVAARWEKAGAAAVGALTALGAGASVAGLVAIARNSINAIDALNDVADATGSSVENISALEAVALRTGASLDTVESSLVKFNSVLKEAKPGSGAEAALKAIGLNAEELRRLDPAEALKKTAEALAGFADDGNKARLTQELFGKSVKEVAPFLKDLAESGQLNATVTKAQAEEAEKFNKQIFALQTNMAEFTRSIVSSVLPTLNDLAGALSRASQSGQGSLLDGIFGTSPVAKLEAQAAGISGNIDRVLGSIERMQTELDRNPGNQALAGRITKARERLADLQRQSQATTAQLKDMANVIDGGPQAAKPDAAAPTKSVGNIPDPDKVNKAADAYTKLVLKLRDLTTTQALQAESDGKLTEVQKASLDVQQAIEAGTLKTTAAQRAKIDALLGELGAQERLNEARKATAKFLEDAAKLNDAAVKRALQQAGAIDQQVTAMRQSTEEVGLQASALADLQRARLLDQAAQKDAIANSMVEAGEGDALIDSYRRQAAALRALATAGKDNADARRREATKQVAQGIVGSSQQGQINALTAQYGELDKALQDGTITTQQYADGLDVLDQRFSDITKPVKEAGDKISAFADQAERNIQSTLGSAFENIFRGQFDNIGQLFRDLLIRMAAQAAAAAVGEKLLGGLRSSGALGGLFKLFGASVPTIESANGTAWSKGVQFYANGDVFGSPTMFKHAGGLGVMGEAGPEAIMPLRRGADGKLGVAAAGGGGMSLAITQNISVGQFVTPGELQRTAEAIRQATIAGSRSAQRRGEF